MAWVYHSGTGRFYEPDGSYLTTGYSGTGKGRNNIDMESVIGVGPIPRATYTIGTAYNDAHLGPVVMHLDPVVGSNVFGRSLFRIHGNNSINDASHGCIILPRWARVTINASRDTTLHVV